MQARSADAVGERSLGAEHQGSFEEGSLGSGSFAGPLQSGPVSTWRAVSAAQRKPTVVEILDRVLDAPVKKLWRCWTEPGLLKQWFCPRPWYVSDVRMDLRPGGEFTSVMHGPSGESFVNAGVFLEVESRRRLVSTDATR